MGDEATMPEGVAKCVKHARLGCAESLPKPFCIDDHIFHMQQWQMFLVPHHF